MKYKVGDKVRINSFEWYAMRKDAYDNIVGTYDSFTIGMAKYCGQTATIVEAKILNASSCAYTLDIDDGAYSWYDFMFEDSTQQLSESSDTMIKTLKITVPEGYEIDYEKSTFKEIVFKKQTISITWNIIHNGVEIIAGDEHFVICCSIPPFHCTWNDAKKYIENDDVWSLPTAKQLNLVKKFRNDINEVIRGHNGYEVYGSQTWTCESEICVNTASCVDTDYPSINDEETATCLNTAYYVTNLMCY